jgi:hypothetical protein
MKLSKDASHRKLEYARHCEKTQADEAISFNIVEIASGKIALCNDIKER